MNSPFIIFLLSISTLLLQVECNLVKTLSSKIESGTACLNPSLQKQVSKEYFAMKFYVDTLCNQHPKSKVQGHIPAYYGARKSTIRNDSSGKLSKYQKGQETFAIKEISNFKYQSLFKELNSSQCFKENFKNDEILNSMVYIIECISEKPNSFKLVYKYYPYTLKVWIDENNKEGWHDLQVFEQTLLKSQMLHLSKTLAALHQKGISHGHLAPEFVLLNSEGSPGLIDPMLLSSVNFYSKGSGASPAFVDYEVVNQVAQPLSSDVYTLLMTFVYMIQGPSKAETVFQNLMQNGGFEAAQYDEMQKYLPRFEDLELPEEFSWMEQMFISSTDGRWTIAQVQSKLAELIPGEMPLKTDPIPQILQEETVHLPIVEIEPKPKSKGGAKSKQIKSDQKGQKVLKKKKKEVDVSMNQQKVIKEDEKIPFTSDQNKLIDEVNRRRKEYPANQKNQEQIDLDLKEIFAAVNQVNEQLKVIDENNQKKLEEKQKMIIQQDQETLSKKNEIEIPVNQPILIDQKSQGMQISSKQKVKKSKYKRNQPFVQIVTNKPSDQKMIKDDKKRKVDINPTNDIFKQKKQKLVANKVQKNNDVVVIKAPERKPNLQMLNNSTNPYLKMMTPRGNKDYNDISYQNRKIEIDDMIAKIKQELEQNYYNKYNGQSKHMVLI